MVLPCGVLVCRSIIMVFIGLWVILPVGAVVVPIGVVIIAPVGVVVILSIRTSVPCGAVPVGVGVVIGVVVPVGVAVALCLPIVVGIGGPPTLVFPVYAMVKRVWRLIPGWRSIDGPLER